MKIYRIVRKSTMEPQHPLWFITAHSAETQRLSMPHPEALRVEMTSKHQMLLHLYFNVMTWLKDGRFGGAPVKDGAFDQEAWKEMDPEQLPGDEGWRVLFKALKDWDKEH
jgi:hypothetical protein